MDKKYETVTLRQLDLMKHALGLDQVGAKPKRGKYTAYRNYFCTYGNDADWEELVKLGVATFNVREPSVYYHVSTDGITMMEGILGFKIVESE
jgi:hypothetical protein